MVRRKPSSFDKDILEFVLSINPTLHVGNHGETKMLLRSAFTGKVPAKILSRRDKIGFVSNESRWFSTNIDLVIDTLKSCKNIPFVDFQAISEDIYKRHKLGYQHHSLYGELSTLHDGKIWHEAQKCDHFSTLLCTPKRDGCEAT